MKLFHELKHGEQYKFKDPIFDGGLIRTAVIIPNLNSQMVLTLEKVETTTEEWVQKNTFRDIPDGTFFKWNKEQNTPHQKISNRNINMIWNDGYLDQKGSVPKYYQMNGSAYYQTSGVWTLEKVTKTEEKWV